MKKDFPFSANGPQLELRNESPHFFLKVQMFETNHENEPTNSLWNLNRVADVAGGGLKMNPFHSQAICKVKRKQSSRL